MASDPQVDKNGKTLTTQCYSATLPEKYRLRQGKGCRAVLNIPGLDPASEFDIGPLTGHRTAEENEQKTSQIITDNGGQVLSSRSVEVGGLPGFDMKYINNVGRPSRLVGVVVASPRWRTPTGETLDRFSVDGPDLPQFDTIVDTITFT